MSRSNWRRVVGGGVAAASVVVTLAPSAHAANPLCSTLPNTVYGAGGSAQVPLLKQLATQLANLATPTTVVYSSAGGACVGYTDLVTPTAVAGTANYWGKDGTQLSCDLPTVGTPATFAAMGNSASLCPGAAPLAAPYKEFLGPVQSIDLIVPVQSSAQSISTEAAYYVWGFGAADSTKTVGKWTVPNDIIKRDQNSFITLFVGLATGIPPTKFVGVDAKSNSNTVTLLAAAAAAGQQENAIGFVSGEVADGSRDKVKTQYEFVLRAEAPTTAPLEGTVRDRHTKKPLVGVKVTVDGGLSATTDAEGKFAFEALLPGERTLTLEGERLTALQTSETLVAGERTTVTYDVEPRDPHASAEDQDDLEIVVTAPTVVKQVVSTAVSAEEARRVPGTQGDVLKVVENLPGVARAAVGSGQVVVWGAAPEDTRVYVNDVPVPRLYHQGGFRSIVHSDLVQSVELVPGGWGAEYGRSLGGLLTVQLKPAEKEGVHGSASADLLDASADVRARIAQGVAVEVAGRKSYLDALLPLATSRNVGEFVPIPRYFDAQARIVWEPSPRDSVELEGLVAVDSVDNTVPSSDPSTLEQQSHDTSFGRLWLRWKRQTDDGAEITVVPSFGVDADTLVDRFGAAPTNLAVHADLVSLRASYRKRLASWVTVTSGVDAQATRRTFRRTGSNSAPPRSDDPFVFGQSPSDQLAHDEGTVLAASVAPYALADVALADVALADGILHLVPGFRLEPYVLSVDRRTPKVGAAPKVGSFNQQTALEPRFSARFSPVPWLTWKVGWGLYHQAPAPAGLSSVFGNPAAGLSSAEHLLGGFALGRPDALSFELTAFYVSQKDLVVRSPLPSPLLAQALVTTGVGRVRGLQVLLRQQWGKRFFGWITYTLSKSERANAEGAPYTPYAFDQTHVLGAVASYDLGAGFEEWGRAFASPPASRERR